MNLTPLLGLWAALIASLFVVVLLRRSVARQEDDHLHYASADRQMVASQAATAHKLDVLDRWRNVLLFVAVVAGLAIGIAYMYKAWEYTSSPHF